MVCSTKTVPLSGSSSVRLFCFPSGLSGNPTAHFTAGITEFAVQTLKEGKSNAELEAVLWNERVNPDWTVFSVGKVVEREREYVLLKEWDSYEVRSFLFVCAVN